MAKMLKDKYGNEFPEGTTVVNDANFEGNTIIGGYGNVIHSESSEARIATEKESTASITKTIVKWIGIVLGILASAATIIQCSGQYSFF